MAMMKRKVFKLELSKDGYQNIRSGILENRYSTTKSKGFTLDYSNEFGTKGAYIVSENIKEKIELPNGSEIEISRPIVLIIKFRIQFKSPQFLELIDPPRSARGLISQLELLSNFSISITAPNLIIEKFSVRASQVVGELTAHKISIQSISLSEQTIATASIRSSKDAIREAKAVFNDRNFKINKATFKNQNGVMEVGCNGAIATSDGFFSEAIDQLINIVIE